jgi:sulfatase maturation enzyme AslB (radical SAM superfamily)
MPARMESPVVDAACRAIATHVESHALNSIDISFHGGEPLLAGVRHFRTILEALHRALPSNVEARLYTQTNGALLSREWCALFDEFRVGVGVSIDGPPSINDLHRIDHRGRSSASDVVRGIKILAEYSTIYAGLLAVVDPRSDPLEVYDFLADLAPPMIDFNLPHATHDNPPMRRLPVLDAEYGVWLARVFDRWSPQSVTSPRIRFFDDVVALTIGARGAVESLGLAPVGIVVIESNGAIEGVDTLKSVAPGASELGLNVFSDSLDDALSHPVITGRHHGILDLSGTCQACTLVDVCGGGLIPHRFKEGKGFRNPSVYCTDLAYLIDHIQGALRSAGHLAVVPH